MKNPVKNPKNKPISSQNSYSASFMWQAGMEFFSGIFVGLIIGYAIDHFFNTKPWGIVIMILLGSAAGFRNIFKLVQTPPPSPVESQGLKKEEREGKND